MKTSINFYFQGSYQWRCSMMCLSCPVMTYINWPSAILPTLVLSDVSSVKLCMLGLFTPQKLAASTNWDFFPSEKQLMNIYYHIMICKKFYQYLIHLIIILKQCLQMKKLRPRSWNDLSKSHFKWQILIFRFEPKNSAHLVLLPY